MAAKQIPIDFKVLRVIAYRYAWLLIVLTFISIVSSSFIVHSRINLYSASITIFVDPSNMLGDIAKGVAVTSSLRDQLTTLQHLILSDDFLEPHVIQELGLRFENVYVPPANLTFMPNIIQFFDWLKNAVKELLGLPIYTQTEEQKRYLQERAMIKELKKGIHLRQSRGSLLLISYNGLNPATCKEIVEILANQCKELLLRNKNQEAREALRYIERQYNETNDKLENLEKELAEMRVELYDKTPEAKIALLAKHQETLDALRILQQDLDELASKKQELIVAKAKRQTVLRSDPEIIAKLATISQNQEAIELNAMKKRLAELQQIYTDEWPEVQELKQKIADRENAIQSRVEEDPEAEEKIFLADPLYNEYFRQITQIETEEASLKTREKQLNDNLAIYEGKLRNIPAFEKSFGALQRKIDLFTGLQLDLARKLETARATKQLEQVTGDRRVQIVARSFPTDPSGISPIILMPLLWMLGPAVGGGIIFLLYYLNDSVKSSEDVQKEYNLPVISVIPKTNFKKELRTHKKILKVLQKRSAVPQIKQSEQPEPTEQLAVQDIGDPEVELFNRVVKRVPTPHPSKLSDGLLMVTMLTNPESQAAEEYRRLCFNVEWGLKEALSGPCKTIMVTSALPAEGKTITALNLATTLARNHSVLLVDSNFRNPAIHHIFGIPPGDGLSDMLANNTTPELYVAEGSPNLSLLPAGLILTHPADLLSSKPMEHFIKSIKSSPYFEYAIFDVPPVTLIPDSSIVASKLDGIVWVIHELRTSKEIVRLALTRITNPAILGIVLNQSEQRALPKKYSKVWKDYQRGGTKKTRGKS